MSIAKGSTANFLKKITTKGVGLSKELLEKIAEKNKDDNVAVMLVVGTVQSSEIKQTTYGDSSKFTGTFEATNLLTDVKFRSRTLYVPDVAAAVLDGLLENAKEGDAGSQFAIQITVQFNNSPQGTRFSFGASSLLAETSSMFDQIYAQIDGGPSAAGATQKKIGKK